jgi:uncharacterized membrane protein HdeD (DUF308 family)
MTIAASHHDHEPSHTGFLASHWWMVLLRGLAAIAFGIVALIWPAMTLLTLVLVYGIFAIADGVLSIIGAITDREKSSSTWLLALVGVLGIIAGTLALVWPAFIAVGLVLYVGLWAIFRGVVDVVTAVRLRKDIPNEWMLALSGVLSIVFGFLIFMAPAVGLLAVIWVIAFCAILEGLLLCSLAFRLRGRAH